MSAARVNPGVSPLERPRGGPAGQPLTIPTLAERLVAYARAAEGRVPLHDQRQPAWTVQLDTQGRILGVRPHPRPPKGEMPYRVLAPRSAKLRANTTAPLLITDNGQYVLGRSGPKDDPVKTAAKHAAYRALLAQVDHPSARAVLASLDALKATVTDPEMQASDLITFQVAGQNVHEDPALQQVWQALARGSGETIMDAVTGIPGPAALYAPGSGMMPGGTTELSYQSSNQSATEAYGIPHLGVTEDTIQAISAALKLLMTNDLTRTVPAGAAFMMLHWLSDPEADDPWLNLEAASEETVSRSLNPDANAPDVDGHTLISLAFVRATGPRLVIFDDAVLSLQEARRHARTFRQRVDGLAMFQVVQEMGLDPTSPPPRAAVHALYRHALTGTPPPRDVAAHTLRRWLAARPERRRLTRAGRAAVQLALQQEFTMKAEDVLPTLPADLQAAFALGHYASVCRAAHRRMNPGVSLTITDRMLRQLMVKPDRTFGQMSYQMTVLLRQFETRRPALAPQLGSAVRAASTRVPLPLPQVFTPQQQTALMAGYDRTEHDLYEADAARRAQRLSRQGVPE